MAAASRHSLQAQMGLVLFWCAAPWWAQGSCSPIYLCCRACWRASWALLLLAPFSASFLASP